MGRPRFRKLRIAGKTFHSAGSTGVIAIDYEGVDEGLRTGSARRVCPQSRGLNRGPGGRTKGRWSVGKCDESDDFELTREYSPQNDVSFLDTRDLAAFVRAAGRVTQLKIRLQQPWTAGAVLRLFA